MKNQRCILHSKCQESAAKKLQSAKHWCSAHAECGKTHQNFCIWHTLEAHEQPHGDLHPGDSHLDILWFLGIGGSEWLWLVTMTLVVMMITSTTQFLKGLRLSFKMRYCLLKSDRMGLSGGPETHPAQQMPGKCCKKVSICHTLVFCTCRMWENPPEFWHWSCTWGLWVATLWFASRWLTFGHFVISGNWWATMTLIGHNDPRGHNDYLYHTVSERSAPQL